MIVSYSVRLFDLISSHLLIVSFTVVLSGHIQKILSDAFRFKNVIYLFFLYQCRLADFLLRSWLYLKMSLCRVREKDLVLFFYMLFSSLLSTTCWRFCLFFNLHFWSLFQKSSGWEDRDYIWVHSSIPLSHMSIFIPEPSFCYYYSFWSMIWNHREWSFK